MNLPYVIRDLRSIRCFSSLEGEKDKIDKIIESAKWAPSAGKVFHPG